MPQLRRIISALSLAVAALLGACGSDASTGLVANIAGNWSGTIVSKVAGNGTVRLTVLQSGSSLSGTWATTFASPANGNSGTISGSVNGTQVAAVLASSVPTACASNLAGVLTAPAATPSNLAEVLGGSIISGTYAAANCSVAESGTFTITKQ